MGSGLGCLGAVVNQEDRWIGAQLLREYDDAILAARTANFGGTDSLPTAVVGLPASIVLWRAANEDGRWNYIIPISRERLVVGVANCLAPHLRWDDLIWPLPASFSSHPGFMRQMQGAAMKEGR